MNKESIHESPDLGKKITAICGSVVRTTVKFFKNLPSRAQNWVRRKITEYKRKPKREDVNKVYVLIGYATKEHIDSKHNAERNLIILNRGLLLIIFFLLLFISINAILPHINVEQYSDMFGISSVEEVTRNDPFSVPGTSTTEQTVPTASATTVPAT
ncbi:MAG: hypothetical protein K6C38_00480 [Saccharofermentans sp.]|jgi:hypothetical protein|nr:hypothetical protein [Saccharofermentans sp.]